MTEVAPGQISEIVEQACSQYKKGLGGVGDPIHQEPQRLEYRLYTGQLVEVELSYVSMCSTTGFPFHRLNCRISLNGKRVTKVQLNNY